jgi:Cys-tRNA(Pro)/Cys-tRNA(Cys) deacylase
MTPAIKLAEKRGITFTVKSYEHDPKTSSYGLEAAEKLSINPAQIFKTLVVKLDTGKLAVGIVPVTGSLNLKNIAKALGAKKAAMAPANEVQRSTGYVLGGVSPLGQKKRLPTVLDASAADFTEIHFSAGKRGLEIAMAPQDLLDLTAGHLASIDQG